MADLSALFQYAPTSAGYMLGQTQAADLARQMVEQNQIQANTAETQQRTSQNAELFPLTKQNRDLTNQTLQAQLPGIFTKNAEDALTLERNQATKNSDIEAKNAENQGKVDDATLKRAQQGQQILMTVGNQLYGVAPPLRRAHLESVIKDMKLNEDSPVIKLLRSVDPERMPDVASTLAARAGAQALAMNPAAQAQMYGHDVGAAATRYSADQHRAGEEGAATIRAEAQLAVRNAKISAQGILQNAVNGKYSMDKAVSTLTIMSAMSTNPEEKAEYDEANRVLQTVMNNKSGNQGKLTLTQDANGRYQLTPNTINAITPESVGTTKPEDYDREIAATKADLGKVTDERSKNLLQQHIAELERQKAAYFGKQPQSGGKQGTKENPIVLK